MKKIFFNVTACICAGLLFTGCNKDKEGEDDVVEGGSSAFDGVIVATNVVNKPNNSQVDVVKAVLWDYDGTDEYELASASYKDGSFTLNLPIPAQDLIYVSDFVIWYPELIVSDMYAKFAFIGEMGDGLIAFKDGEAVGNFWHGYQDDNVSNLTCWWYVDRNVSITGTANEGRRVTKFELFLKKGWNIAWSIENDATDTGSLTTSTGPSSLLKWHYRDWSSYNVSQARTAKSTGKHKAFSIGGIVESELMGGKK